MTTKAKKITLPADPNFREARPKIPYEKYKLKHFLWSRGATTKKISSPNGTVETIFFNNFISKDPGTKQRINFTNYTLVETDRVAKELKIPGGKGIIAVKVKILDIDPLFVGVSSEKDNLLPVPFAQTGEEYWVPATAVWSIDPDLTPDLPQTPSPVSSFDEVEDKLESDWYRHISGTVLEDSFSFYIVNDTLKTTWADENEHEAIKKLALENALYDFVQSYSLSSESASKLPQYATVFTDYISNRPGSTYKVCVKVPKEIISAVDTEFYSLDETTPPTFSLNTTFEKFLTATKNIQEYFISLDPVVKKENLTLDLLKEASLLEKAVSEIAGVFKTNKQHPTQPAEEICITFSTTPLQIGFLMAVPSAPPSPPESLSEIEIELDDENSSSKISGILIDTRGKFQTPLFQRHRTLFFIMNCIEMSEDIGKDTNAATNKIKWTEFLPQYVATMPMYYPSDTINRFANDTTLALKNKIKEIEKSFPPITTLEKREELLRSITPAIKGQLAELKATAFEKIQDPSMRKIFENVENINSLDSLYEMVLSKIPIEKLISLGKESISSLGIEKNYFTSFEDTVDNINIPQIDEEDLRKQANAFVDEKVGEVMNFQDNLIDEFKNSLAFDLPDLDTIQDVSAGAQDKIFDQMQELMVSTLTSTVKDILRKIKKSVNEEADKIKSKMIGALDLKNTLKDKQLLNIKDKINKNANVEINTEDTKKVLDTISEFCSPLEILSLFEGEGSAEAIDILSRQIPKAVPVLADKFSNFYDAEELLMIAGRDLTQQIEDEVATSIIERENDTVIDSFCADGLAGMGSLSAEENVINHLQGRFPEKFAADQLAKNDQRRKEFSDFLDGLESALDNDLNNFLFGSKLDDLLDEMGDPPDDPASSFVDDLLVRSFFEPVGKVFDIESLDVGYSFLENNFIETDDPGASRLNISPVTNQDVDNADDFTALKESQSSKPVVAKLKLKDGVEKLHQILDSGTAVSWNRGNTPSYRFTLDGNSFLEMSLSIPSAPLLNPSPVNNVIPSPIGNTPLLESVEEQGEALEDIPSVINYRGVINNKEIFNYNVNTPLTSLETLITPEDTGFVPQATAFSRVISNILEKNFSSITSQNTDKILEMSDLVKEYLFLFLNQSLINFISRQAAKSSFFKVNNLIKLKLSTTDDDIREPPLLCDQVSTEEGSARDELIPEIFDMEEIIEEVKNKKKYFAALEKEKNVLLNNRRPMENALIMTSVDLFFRTLVVEYLISGVFVFNETSGQSMKKIQDYTIIQQLLFKTLDALGENFKNTFYEILEQYAEYRQGVGEKNSDLLPMPTFLLDDDDLTPIINFILDEQMFDVFPSFQRSVQLVSSNDKLEIDDFIDTLPEVNVASSVATKNIRFSGISNSKFTPHTSIGHTLKYGGFILEKYIRTDFSEGAIIPELNVLLDNQTVKQTLDLKTFNDEGTSDFKFVETLELDENSFFKNPNIEGVVNLNSFKEMQETLSSAPTIVTYGQELDNQIQLLSELSDKQVLLNNILESKKQNIASWNIHANALNAGYLLYKDTFSSSFVFKVENTEYSDQFIFEWEDLEELEALSEFGLIFSVLKNLNQDDKEKYDEAVLKSGLSATDYIKTLEGDLLHSFLESLGAKGNIYKQLSLKYEKMSFQFEDLIKKTKSYYTALKQYIFNADEFLDGKKPWSGEGSPPQGSIAIEIYDQVMNSREKASERVKSLDILKIEENFVSMEEVVKSLQIINTKQDDIIQGKYEADYSAFFENQKEGIEKTIKDLRVKSLRAPYTDIISSLKYGIRICYVYPNWDENFNDGTLHHQGLIKDPASEHAAITALKEKYDLLTGAFTDEVNITEKSFKIREHVYNKKIIPELSTTIKTNTFYMTPLVTLEKNVSDIFIEKNTQPETLPDTTSMMTDYPQADIAVSPAIPLPSEGLLESNINSKYIPNLLNQEIIDNFPLAELKDELIQLPLYKQVFSDIMLYPDLVSSFGMFCAMSTLEDSFKNETIGLYSGTKVKIKNTITATETTLDFSDDLREQTMSEEAKQQIAQLSNPAGNFSDSGGNPVEKIGQAAIFAAKTGLMILKGVAETTDPAIIRGKKIQAAFNSLLKAGDKLSAKKKKSEMDSENKDSLTDQDSSEDKPNLQDQPDPGFSLLAATFLGLPFPPIPPPPAGPGDPSTPLTPLGAIYLALSTGIDLTTPTDQEAEKADNPDQNCIDD